MACGMRCDKVLLFCTHPQYVAMQASNERSFTASVPVIRSVPFVTPLALHLPSMHWQLDEQSANIHFCSMISTARGETDFTDDDLVSWSSLYRE